jgi:hypothetical protein
MQSIGWATETERDKREYSSRSHAFQRGQKGRALSLAHAQTLFGVALDVEQGNSTSMRLTAANATGEIAAAFFPRRALAPISASSKNCHLACDLKLKHSSLRPPSTSTQQLLSESADQIHDAYIHLCFRFAGGSSEKDQATPGPRPKCQRRCHLKK